MIDQIVWILGRPVSVTTFLRQDVTGVAGFSDNTLGVLEFDSAMAFVDIAATLKLPRWRVDSRCMARLDRRSWSRSNRQDRSGCASTRRRGGFPAGVSMVEVEDRPRYVDNLASFVKALRGENAPDSGPWTTNC